jgi:hypothetical protein
MDTRLIAAQESGPCNAAATRELQMIRPRKCILGEGTAVFRSFFPAAVPSSRFFGHVSSRGADTMPRAVLRGQLSHICP